MQLGLSMASRISHRVLGRSAGSRFSSKWSLLAFRPQKMALHRRMFSYQPQPITPSTSNPTFTLLSAGGLMLSTYLVLDHMLNKHDEFDKVATKTVISPSVHSFLKGTYTYVAGGLAITAVSSIVAFRSGMAVRILYANPVLYMGGSLAALLGTTYLARSISHKESPILKHLAWGASMATIGALSCSPLLFVPTPILYRAALYTAGIVGSLSFVAINAEEAQFLFLGGPLFAGLTVVALSSVAGVFLPTAGAAFNVAQSISLYGGLAVFGGLVLYDTQLMVEEAKHNSNPDPDFIEKSYSVYFNILNIFVRLVQILASVNGGSRKN